MTATCASGSRSNRLSASARWRTNSSLKALSRSGRFRLSVAIWLLQAYSTRLIRSLPLFVEPHILEAPAIVLAVGHHRQPLDLGLPAGRRAQVVDDRARQVFLQLVVDIPHQLFALCRIGFR